jgi:hypothetical protein
MTEVKAFANYLHTFENTGRGKYLVGLLSIILNAAGNHRVPGWPSLQQIFGLAKVVFGFFSLMWEDGKDREATAFLDDRGIIKEQ